MSIYSEPYPKQGADQCPSVFVAQSVIRCAFTIDGEKVMGDDFKDLIEIETHVIAGVEVYLPSLEGGVKISKLRKPIAALWNRMSKKAKAAFLYTQWNAAVTYLDNCMDNIMEELGTVGATPISMPSYKELFGDLLDIRSVQLGQVRG